MTLITIFILSLVEGLTEFLPVSSTGHLILTSHFLGLEQNDFLKAFEVIIQFGAIMAVVVLYFKKFKLNFTFYKKLMIGAAPALVAGFILKNKIDALLDSTTVVAWSLIIGGLIFIATDIYLKPNSSKNEVTELDSFKIGLFQCFALIPGVSRSGATIVGAQFLKYTKTAAAEFSFFLAVPVLSAATIYKTWKIRSLIDSHHLGQLAIGTFLSFVFALLAIKFFIKIVSKYGFKWFGVYRIILGVLVLFNT